MPPKPKDTPKKATPNIVRQPVSDSSLLYVPQDAVEGYQERLDSCVEWTTAGAAIRHHKEKCRSEDIPELPFSQALQNKLQRSILSGFLNKDSTLSLKDYWEVILPILTWDSENNPFDEVKCCFRNNNNITDDLSKMIKKAVALNDRDVLTKELKATHVLRVTDSQMTILDEGLLEYPHLTSLSLCGNYLSEIDANLLPHKLRMLEMQANRISNLDSFKELPPDLLYVGLARNLLTNDGIEKITFLPRNVTVLDLSDNDIYNLEPLLDLLVRLPNLQSLMLAGNPCSVCAAYSRTVFMRLRRLKYLDNRQILSSDRPDDHNEPHPNDLRSAYFIFTVIRIISAPMPPKPEKGATAAFHVELELPLFDSIRRNFLMFRRKESLTEFIPMPEDYDYYDSHHTVSSSKIDSKIEIEAASEETDIFARLEPKNSRVIQHFTTFESNRVPWNKIMNFQEPTIKIFCPDLVALRDTFRSTITLKLVYTLCTSTKKQDKRSAHNLKQSPGEQHVTIATFKCTLKTPDWSQGAQHFYWDETLDTQDAIHWGDGDLTALQYQQTTTKPVKGKPEQEKEKQTTPEILTCHLAFGIDTLKI